MGHLLAKIRSWAAASNLVSQETNGCLLLDVTGGQAGVRLRELVELTSPAERDALKVSFCYRPLDDLSELLRAVLQSRSLTEWAEMISHEWLGDVMREGRLTSFFQPVMWCDSTEIFGFEALLRGYTQEGDIISAFSLLNAARASNALFALDQQARSTSIHCAQNAGLGERRLLINFVPTVIYDPAVCLGTTMRAIKETGLRPDQIIFEVVETEQVQDSDFLQTVLKYYREMGFGVALDDLGAGHSSLLLLAELQPDYAKLDMRLVQAAMSHRMTERLVDSIISIARSEGIRIIAEGIETEETYLYCRDKGIDLVQGFYFGRPAPEMRSHAVENAALAVH